MIRFLFIWYLFSLALFAQPNVPLLSKYATDYTNTLTSEQLNFLNNKLIEFEDSTSNQLIFLMIPTLEDYPIEYFSNEVAEKNKIGQKSRDNGILFLVVKNDKKLRLEVGYGLEGVLPDALASSIIRNVVVPYFKEDKYFEGINAGLNAIISATKGEFKADKKVKKKGGSIFQIIFFILILLFALFRRRRRGGFIYLGGLPNIGGGFGSSGGFGGGGFSGGGGSFGGGGASGSW